MGKPVPNQDPGLLPGESGETTVMQKSTKKALSFSVLIAAAVVFGTVVAGSVHVTPRTEAQKSESHAPPRPTRQLLLPSFADIAEEVMPSVVSITSTEIVKAGSGQRRNFGGGGGDTDPFEFFFGPQGPNSPHRRGLPDED